MHSIKHTCSFEALMRSLALHASFFRKEKNKLIEHQKYCHIATEMKIKGIQALLLLQSS